MRRLFYLVIATLAVALVSSPGLAAATPPSGDIDQIKIDTGSFHQRPCVTGDDGKKSAAVTFTFTSRGTGTVRVTVKDKGRVLNSKDDVHVDSSSTTVEDFRVPEIDGKPMFEVEAEHWLTPPIKQTAFDSTSVINIAQGYCAMNEPVNAMKEPPSSAIDKIIAWVTAVPKWVWALVVGLPLIAFAFAPTRWRE